MPAIFKAAVSKTSLSNDVIKRMTQLFVLLIGLGLSLFSHAAPTFSLAFSPTTIGPNSVSTLTYTVNNSVDPTAITGVTFNNTLPAGLVIASPSRASTTCLGGQFTATSGGDTLTFTDYRLSAQATCTLSVDVTSASGGAYVNTTGTLTTNTGNVSTANGTLTIDAGRAGMSMAFSPSTINQGAVSQLTFTVDNTLNGSDSDILLFAVNTLPLGIVVSDQPQAATTCTGGSSTPVITAVAGSNSVTFAKGFAESGTTCTISVNVTAIEAGQYTHVGNSISRNGSNPSGLSAALLTVINPFLGANFPASVAAGTSIDLTYTLTNSDRDNTATDITFTNDLNATLSGLSATALPASGFCGAGSTITGSSTITVAGANLASGASCSFTLTALIPANAANGTYTNTTSTVNLNLGSATTKPALSHSLVVNNAPQLSMEFIDDPLSVGNDVTLRYTLTNADLAQGASGITFTMDYDVIYTGITVNSLPNANTCGVGSTFTSSVNSGGSGEFKFNNGTLAAGANCTFDVVLTLPAGGITGSFLHTTSTITATMASMLVTGNRASDTLVVLAGPRLSIELPEESAAPGETITAIFTLEYSENASADISNIGFSIDLDNALTGLTMSSGSASDICGTGSSITGTSTLTFSGGSLAATEQCTFSVSLLIPPGTAPIVYNLVSSAVTGTVAAQSVSASAASDTQTVTGLTLSKSFLTSPVAAGDSVTMRYTITNSANALAASDIQFTDRISQVITSLSAISLPSTPCGAGSQITGTTSLTFAAGSLAPGASCNFDVPLLVPGGATAGAYNSPTSDISATVNGINTTTPAGAGTLFVDALEVLISSTQVSPTEASPIPVAIHFTRAVTNFIVTDLDITNGIASNFSGSGLAYSVDITPTSFGSVVITLPATTVDDAVFTGVQNASQSLSLEYVDVPVEVAVTVPATAINSIGNSYTIAGTHGIAGSKVYLYADSDNNGVADNATILASDTAVNGDWSMTTSIDFQVPNNFVVVWNDRVNRVTRSVNVPTITEVTPNFDPVISGAPSTNVDEDAAYSFTPTMTDANSNDTHLFSITNAPSWASFDTATGALTGTPLNANVGAHSNIVITVTDSSNLSSSLNAFDITVTNTNDAPEISGTPVTSIAEDAPYSFVPSTSDVDVGDSEIFSITNAPSWASFDTSTGALTGTPTNDDVGVFNNIIISVADSVSADDTLAAFNITVTNSNDAPVISGTPNTSIAEDAPYSFVPSTSDVDAGDSEIFSITNAPSWASFDTASGALTGTPSNSDVGLASNIVITVTDSANASDSLAAFSLNVTNTNDAPVISGTPSTSVAQDVAYSFTPAVNDVDTGDTTTFSITNAPAWASFNTSTGELSGTPTNDDIGLSSAVVITVTDSANADDSLAAFDLSVTNVNDAPVISGTPNTAVAEDSTYSFTPTVTDIDAGDSKSFSINNLPSWASFDTATGALTGTPTNSDLGLTSNIVITVTDSGSSSVSLAAFSITVSNTNDAPVISGVPDGVVQEDTNYSFTPTVSDDDIGDTTSFSIVNAPSWANFDASTGALTGTPTNSDVGTTSAIVITVSDSEDVTSSLTAFSITVNNVNDAPTISGSPNNAAAEDAIYSFTPTLTDVDTGDTATFSIVNAPSWASFNPSTGALTGTPTNDDIGVTTNVVITVTDSANASDSLPAFTITVSNTNDAPTITGTPNVSVAEDSPYSFTPSASDVDTGDTKTFSITNPPTWANFDSATGTLSGTPANSDVGLNNNIVISVSDSANASASLAAFSITVSNTNDAPVISGAPSTSVDEDALYTFTPSVNDDDSGDSTTFSITNQPSWTNFNASTGTLSGTPTNSDVGTSSAIVISVSDSANATDSLSAFSITISNTNDAPIISGVPSSTVAEDAAYSFTPTASDDDSGDTATFSIVNTPSWASFDTSTGALTGTPNNSHVGLTSNIVITVTDAQSSSDSLAAFSINVSNTNDAPVISGTPNTNTDEDTPYSFTPEVSDDDSGDSTTFSIANRPTWASFDTNTGTLSGTPSNADVGTNSAIVITVTDSANATASLSAFSITVINTNDAPTISGTPNSTAAEDSPYSFIPTAVDDDSADAISFSITNMPSWASFDTTTGALTGTPSNDDIGMTSNIIITVTDSANASTSLSAFSLSVGNTNDAPLITGTPPVTVEEDASYSFTPTVSDVDSDDTLTFNIVNAPSWVNFNNDTGALTGTPSNNDVGISGSIIISVADGAGAIASLTAFTITVTNTNDAPTITGVPNSMAAEDVLFSFTPETEDIDDGDILTFTIENTPSWATFDTETGRLTGTPSNGDLGLNSGIIITVTDTAGVSASLPTFSVMVTNTNDPVMISGTPNDTVAQDAAYNFTPSISDEDVADTVIFSIDNKPEWAIFDTATGALTGTPTNSDVGPGETLITISATDSGGAIASLAPFTITVTNINDAPTISGTPSTVIAEDSPYSFTPTMSDIDADDTQSFTIDNKPSWATFDSLTGALSGTPTNTDLGLTSDIVITVSDASGASASLPAFNLLVSNTNDVPVITGMPITTVEEDGAYSFVPAASDADAGDVIFFSIMNRPSWANFDTSTGALTGMPLNNDVGVNENIVISVEDSSGAIASLTAFGITVTNTNDAPVIAGTPSTAAGEDTSYSFTPTVSDVDVGDTLSLTISNLPNWATFDTQTGALTGTPTNADLGLSSAIIISVSDAAGASSDLPAFSILVSNTNDAPIISGIPDSNVDEDAVYSFTPIVSDDDSGDSATFSIMNQPSWASFDTTTGTLSGTPTNSDVGISSGIIISVTDSAGAISHLAVFSITVVNTNDTPIISGIPGTAVIEGDSYNFTPTMSDDDLGDTALFSINNLPSWADFDADTGALTGMPNNSDVGTYNDIVISVNDSANASASLLPFNITVSNANTVPVIGGRARRRVAEDANYSFIPTFSDADAGDTAIFSIDNRPVWLVFNASTGALTGSPTNDDIGTFDNIVITVTDSAGATASLPAFSIAVANSNDAPVISGLPNTSVTQGSLYSFTPIAIDVDAKDTLTFSITNQPAWASFDTVNGVLSGTPTNSDVGSYDNIVISVNDLSNAIDSLEPFTILVVNTNDLPYIGGIPLTTVEQDAPYSFTPVVNDEDVGSTLAFSIINQPTWANFDTTSGALTGTPKNSDVGVYANVTISVDDGAGGVGTLAAFSITVTNVNDAPEITGTPLSAIKEGESYSFTPTVTDVDSDDTQTYSITNLPSWASFDADNGTLAGVPEAADIGAYGGIVITVTDSANAAASLAVFSINVTNINTAPVISGSPIIRILEDVAYSFTPTVIDPDSNDIKVFSIANQPQWLSFNPSNGALTGTPTSDDVGVYSDIVITITDSANASASLSTFSITVVNVNDAPIALDDTFTLTQSDEGYLLDVLENDSDEEGDTLSILSIRSTLEGLTIEQGQLRFVPSFEIDSVEFEYLISDGKGGQDTATVTLNIEISNTVLTGPVITVPEDIEVNATGIYTRVDLGVATAVDSQGNILAVSLLNGNKQFTSGIHKAYWQATDSAGSSTVREQEVRVNPIVSLTKGQIAAEGNQIQVSVILSGEAPQYPVIVPYSVNGTADDNDHDLIDGQLILSSTQGEILFEILDDGVFEETETIIVTLAGEALNQGSQNTHTVEIVDGNIAPSVTLTTAQNGVQRSLIEQNGGLVDITASVTDPNTADSHSYLWETTHSQNVSDTDNVFTLDPVGLAPGLYSIDVIVTDNGTPNKTMTSRAYFEVAEELPTLTSGDSDGDLIPDDIEGLGDDDGDGIVNYLDDNNITNNVLPSDINDQSKFLIESPTGTQLRKGLFAAGNEQGGGVLSELDVDLQLPADTEAQSVGVIFDFVMYGLPIAGQSYSIVLPQQEAIPANALYRKYLNGIWVDFVTDERNAIYSAQGEAGYCPPPQDSTWQLGLTEGHWCVQLSMEDGGPNDDDGEANGAIVDPGGIAVMLSDNNFPVVRDDTIVIFTGESVETNVLTNDTDADDDRLIISSAAANIGLSVITAEGTILYTPPANFVGSDLVIYSITDGNGGTASGTLTIEIVQKDEPVSVEPPVMPVTQVTPANTRVSGGAVGWLALLTMLLLCMRGFWRIHLQKRNAISH